MLIGYFFFFSHCIKWEADSCNSSLTALKTFTLLATPRSLSGRLLTDATPTLLLNLSSKLSTDKPTSVAVFTCTISRNGDLAYRTYLQVTLPEINQLWVHLHRTPSTGVYARWLDFPGEQLIAQVEVEIGGQRIDRQYGDWMHIWNQLTLTSEQQAGYFKMIGNTTQLTFITDPSFADVDGPCDSQAPRQVCAPRNALPETTLYVPLQFWFCRNPGLALPLIALQYHEVKINLDIRPIDECLWAVTTLAECSGRPRSPLPTTSPCCCFPLCRLRVP